MSNPILYMSSIKGFLYHGLIVKNTFTHGAVIIHFYRQYEIIINDMIQLLINVWNKIYFEKTLEEN